MKRKGEKIHGGMDLEFQRLRSCCVFRDGAGMLIFSIVGAVQFEIGGK